MDWIVKRNLPKTLPIDNQVLQMLIGCNNLLVALLHILKDIIKVAFLVRENTIS